MRGGLVRRVDTSAGRRYVNGLEFVCYVAPDAVACPLCGFAHVVFTGIGRRGSTVEHAPLIEETIPARILGWALQCGCLLSVAEWEWVSTASVPMRWVRKADD